MQRPTIFIAATFLVVQSAFAQDPVKLSPKLYTVLLENEQVRVLEFRAKPGDKEPLHFHPNGVAYVIEAGKARATTNGKTEELDGKPGMTADRKSTRLNSSHSQISYAVFCLKKKKNIRRAYT